MAKPTLLVLAAGMGSRYGSLKQMDGVGPGGEAIIDYSIYDAVRAGFGKVVFVIRHLFEKDFREVFSASRFNGLIEVDFVFQELDKLPAGFIVPLDRVKPWGTNHAVMMGAEVIKTEPFAVINADDFYGRDAFRKIGAYLTGLPEGSRDNYCMVGYEIKNTLSEYGTVSRGVCGVDAHGNLESMVERTAIERVDGTVIYRDEDGTVIYRDEYGTAHPLAENTPVSMNLFGFTPDYFKHSEDYFAAYLKENISHPRSEFYIPTMVNKLVEDKTAVMKVLHTSSKWFGVTYREDRPEVVGRIADLVKSGEYPEKLWK